MTEEKTVYPIRAVSRVCDLLDALQHSSEDTSLRQLAKDVAMPKSSVLRYLSVLEARRYVERDRLTGSYRLGLALRPQLADYLGALTVTSAPFLSELRDHFDETINLGILDGAEVVHTYVADSLQSVRLSAYAGERAAIHSTAMGKAVCTLVPEQRVREILAHSGMPEITPETITEPERFMAEVRRTAARGYGIDNRENQPDGRCIAVALPGLLVPAAVSVSGPASRFGAADESARVADELKDRLGGLDEALRSMTMP